jgi:hypothetical protein
LLPVVKQARVPWSKMKGFLMKHLLAGVLLLSIVTPSQGWNDHGNLVAARIAWNKANDQQRTAVLNILRKHPHYEEFLAAKCPEGLALDEWGMDASGNLGRLGAQPPCERI